jgi:hypothetical protein
MVLAGISKKARTRCRCARTVPDPQDPDHLTALERLVQRADAGVVGGHETRAEALAGNAHQFPQLRNGGRAVQAGHGVVKRSPESDHLPRTQVRSREQQPPAAVYGFFQRVFPADSPHQPADFFFIAGPKHADLGDGLSHLDHVAPQ